MLPNKRHPARSGILREPKREWPRHRKFVRSHECVCSLTIGAICSGRIEFSHIRTAANSGTGLKPHDASGVPMCADHHLHYHRIGHISFERQYGLSLVKLAAEFASKSPDKKMLETAP